MTKKDKLKLLNRTKKVLQDNGWCQGIAHNAEGKFCLLGAINEAAVQLGIEYPEQWAVEEIIDNTILRKTKKTHLDMWISKWNDAPGRKIKEVFKVIDDSKKYI